MATMIGTVVDSCNMAFRGNTHLVQSQKVGGVGGEGGLFWGSSKSSLWGTVMENKLRKKSSVCRAQGGVVSSVLADVNKETLIRRVLLRLYWVVVLGHNSSLSPAQEPHLLWRYPTSNDFGSEIIPAAVHEHNVKAYMFNDYWEDIGTIRSFFDANLALTDQVPKFQFYDSLKPFYTSPRFLPPSKVDNCRDTVMMGADYYQTEAEIASLLAEGSVPVGVGKNTKIRNCIIDMNAKIGKDVIIANTDGVQEADRPSEGFHIRSGITVILKNSTIKDGTII
ncbi:hypothetical protein QJS10_CPA01g01205 [Acorus calamus]|uniref:glucose-1-phosphate adenylyltransferase n=1 Tax=Acorus calamus TaxID=4465 RepID=A0AAV9FJX9_ACOCL|nr:hypothetical protein QJS10_CPA01g01205 [Acorus calamus]